MLMSKKHGRAGWADKLKQLGATQALLVLAGLGLVVFAVGLASPFQGDDNQQIVDSPPVHSLGHLGTLFSSSTFYNGQQLTGSYYRPLMTTAYAVIYSLAGPHPWAFHLVQLAVCIVAAWLFYLILRRFIGPGLSLAFAAVFLIHPLNSQVALAIPSLQDALLGVFGFFGLWLVINRPERRWQLMAAAALLFALLAKETGIVMALLAAAYLWLFDRKRLKSFGLMMLVALAIYAVLRINALGFGFANNGIAPIDHLTLAQRLLTLPSILVFYLGKLLLPWNLATRYYWTQPGFSLTGVLVPLIISAAAIGWAVWAGRRVYSNQGRAVAWFGLWIGLGLLPYLQLVPLDMTACANWFYLPLAGILAILGLALKNRQPSGRAVGLAAAYGAMLAGLTVLQGTYYQSPLALARHDLAASPQDYAAMGEVAKGLIDEGHYHEAISYARQSAQSHPTMFGYQNLGVALQQTGDYDGAWRAYTQALRYGNQASLYENLGLAALEAGGDFTSKEQVLKSGLAAYPQDFKLWLFYALFEDAAGHNDRAQSAITSASQLGQVPPQLSQAIMDNQPFTLPLPGTDRSVVVP